MELKFCRKCQEWKSVDQFYKRNRGGCIKCVREYQAKYYLEHYAAPIPESLPEGLKKCSTCKEIKPFDKFYRDKSEKDGFHHHCKECSNEMKRKRLGYGRRLTLMSPKGYRKCNKCKSVRPLSDFKSVTSANCKECTDLREKELEEKRATASDRRRAYIREWTKNPSYQARQKDYRSRYQRRPDVITKNRLHNARYRDNPEHRLIARRRTRAWYKANREHARYLSLARIARKKNAEGSYTSEQWQMLLSFFDSCPRCGKVEKLTCDHIIPLSQGGTDYLDNLQALCPSCNSSKNAYQIVDYRPREARYWAFAEMSFVYLDI